MVAAARGRDRGEGLRVGPERVGRPPLSSSRRLPPASFLSMPTPPVRSFARGGFYREVLEERLGCGSAWAGAEFPSARDLDAAFPAVPVYLDRIDGHATWVNSATLRLANVPLGTVHFPGL